MTLREAVRQRIPRVRDPKWANPHAYLRIPLFTDGTVGPWAELYDDVTQQEVLNLRPGSQRIIFVEGVGPLNFDDEVEVYTGQVSSFEQHRDNFAKGYAER